MTTQLEMVPKEDQEQSTSLVCPHDVVINVTMSFIFLTRYLHLQQWEDFYQKYGNPAEGIREHYEEKPVGYSYVSVQSAPHVCGIDASFIDGAEHAGVREDDHQECHQV